MNLHRAYLPSLRYVLGAKHPIATTMRINRNPSNGYYLIGPGLDLTDSYLAVGPGDKGIRCRWPGRHTWRPWRDVENNPWEVAK